eukprot:GILJ01032137.1.p1 GENE.GILJ01032137.1~~GILJ01032137.1.p1  ORF type:complete len:556 (-),score=80.75 GILJ01032137.1:132-1628(-)
MDETLRTSDDPAAAELLRAAASGLVRFSMARRKSAIALASRTPKPPSNTMPRTPNGGANGSVDIVSSIGDASRLKQNSSRIVELLNFKNINFDTKPMSLKWVQRMIKDLYDAKLEADAACDRLKMPRRPFPQFVYAFVSKKHGFPNLVDQKVWDMIVTLGDCRGMKPEVELFAEFLEESRSLDELSFFLYCRKLLTQMMAAYSKSHGKQQGIEFVTKGMLKQLLDTVSTAEQESYKADVERRVKMNQTPVVSLTSNAKIQITDDLVSTHELLEAMLDLFRGGEMDKKHVALLVQAFQIMDTDKDGWINRQQFSRLLSKTHPRRTSEQVDVLYEKIADETGTDLVSIRSFTSILVNMIRRNQLVVSGHILRAREQGDEAERKAILIVSHHWATIKEACGSYLEMLDKSQDDEDIEAGRAFRKAWYELDRALATATHADEALHCYRKLLFIILCHQTDWQQRFGILEPESLEEELRNILRLVKRGWTLYNEKSTALVAAQ